MATSSDIATLREAFKRVAGAGLRVYATAEPNPGSTDAPGQEYLVTITVKDADPPPVPEPPPAPASESLRATQVMKVRSAPGLSGTQVGSIGAGVVVKVDATSKPVVDGYQWRNLLDTYPGKFVAERNVTTGEVYLNPQ